MMIFSRRRLHIRLIAGAISVAAAMSASVATASDGVWTNYGLSAEIFEDAHASVIRAASWSERLYELEMTPCEIQRAERRSGRDGTYAHRTDRDDPCGESGVWYDPSAVVNGPRVPTQQYLNGQTKHPSVASPNH